MIAIADLTGQSLDSLAGRPRRENNTLGDLPHWAKARAEAERRLSHLRPEVVSEALDKVSGFGVPETPRGADRSLRRPPRRSGRNLPRGLLENKRLRDNRSNRYRLSANGLAQFGSSRYCYFTPRRSSRRAVRPCA